jgi:hypothetical protein
MATSKSSSDYSRSQADRRPTVESDTEVNAGGKPLQIIPWADKVKDDNEWFKRCVDYHIKLANFNYSNPTSASPTKQDLPLLYDVYNNKFPLTWFAHVTDPLSAKVPAHKNFPTKVRPVNILRTNLDQLMAEYPRRPFIYQVNNLGDDGYSRYMDEQNKKINQATTQYFQLALQQQLQQQGLMTPDGKPASPEAQQQIQQQMDNIQYPEDIKSSFQTSYRDKIAIQAQKWLRRAMREQHIRPKLGKMFKDWLIAGQAYSYKGVEFGNLVYERVSPLMFEYDKSPDEDYIENGQWASRKIFMTQSEVVERFYDELTQEDQENLDKTIVYATPTSFLNHLNASYSQNNDTYNKVPVYHVQWKGRKLIYILTQIDPQTGQVSEITVDEDYKFEPGDKKEPLWVNEVYEGWRIGDLNDLYVRLRPVPVQRNAMNNFAACKLSYNGRRYSDTHSHNISVMEIGLPFQIMYIIVTRTLELTIAKSKGKIFLVDKNAIPNTGDWDDEKFFYYAEALGYALLDRNQIGVDKSFNQYQVVDMTLFDSISQLIELQGYFKQQWDDIIGFNRQRKGQTYASDLKGVNEAATFQSTVITDMIFNLFEEFVEMELQGIIDMSKFCNVDGVRKVWFETQIGNELLEIDPETYCNAELGIYLESSTEAIAIKNKMEATVQAMIQNAVRPSTILEVLQTQNVAELMAKLKDIEAIQDQVAAQNQQSEEDAAKQADERKKQFLQFQMILEEQLVDKTYDRKEDLEYIKGSFSLYTMKSDDDANGNGIPDQVEVEKLLQGRQKIAADREQSLADRQERISKHQIDVNLKEKALNLQQENNETNADIQRQKIELNRKS